MLNLNAKVPDGPLEQKWDQHRFSMKLVNPANKRRIDVIVVGTGLAGGAASAALAELGYNVKTFCFQDSPRRAHSIAAQGGINAAKNYQNDGDSIQRLFYDTVKGGDFRAREANVYRLAQISVNIIDQCVAQGVPFAREYGGLLANRSFGGAQVSRTFYARGQTGQQLLLGAYQALMRQVEEGRVQLFARTEMLDLVVIDGRARGIITRNLMTGKIERHLADAVVLGTGGYGNVFYLSTNAKGCNATAIWRAHRRGALLANPCYTQIHPTCIPVSGSHQSKLTLMSESLRNDGRIWVPKEKGDKRSPDQIPEAERDDGGTDEEAQRARGLAIRARLDLRGDEHHAEHHAASRCSCHMPRVHVGRNPISIRSSLGVVNARRARHNHHDEPSATVTASVAVQTGSEPCAAATTSVSVALHNRACSSGCAHRRASSTPPTFVSVSTT